MTPGEGTTRVRKTKPEVARAWFRETYKTREAASEEWEISLGKLREILGGRGATPRLLQAFARGCGRESEWQSLLAEQSNVHGTTEAVPDAPEQVTHPSIPLSVETPESGPTPLNVPDGIRLDELGPFLGHYAELVGLSPSTIITAYQGQEAKGQWAIPDESDLEAYLTEVLYKGGNTDIVPFDQLLRLMYSFDDGHNLHDVPALMAEWLCATPTFGDWIRLDVSEFRPPPRKGRAAEMQHGIRCDYRNASTRLAEMECALVRFDLKGNTALEIASAGSSAPDHASEEMTLLAALQGIGNEEVMKNVPHSRPHVHPGDEFIFVIEGNVFVELANTGILTPLQRGDYAHFNADIPHAVWNLHSKPASAIIIRFFQLKRYGTRRRQVELLRMIQKLMGKLSQDYQSPEDRTRIGLLSHLESQLVRWIGDSKKCYRLWSDIAPWVHDRTRPPQDRLRHTTNQSLVQDLVGLSRFLHGYIGQLPDAAVGDDDDLRKLRNAVRELERLPEGETEDEWEASFQRLIVYSGRLEAFLTKERFRGLEAQVRNCIEGLPGDAKTSPTTETLIAIAEVLGMPRVLLDGYLAPNALRVVAIRGADRYTKRHTYDWVNPPTKSQGHAIGAHYKLPSRTLANSDLSIVLLSLEPGGFTAWNRHPGFELIIPMPGSGPIRIDYCRSSSPPTPQSHFTSSEHGSTGSIIVYKSGEYHRVINDSTVDARMLVIRFNR